MTISSESIMAGPFAGDGSTVALVFTFKTLNETHLSVVETASNGVDSTLVLTTDYTVALNADQDVNPGGTLTLVTATVTGAEVNIHNEPPFTQLIDLLAAGAWNPQTVEGALDRLTILAKRARDRTGLDWRGAWTTGRSYLVGNLVSESGNIYYALTDHTSGTFATDLTADKWVLWVEQGGIGPSGGAGGLLYAFDSSTTTNGDPGSGDIRLNNATLASVSEIAISDNTDDSGAPDVGAWIATWANNAASGVRGYIMMKKVSDSSSVAIYSITAAAVDGTTYWRFTVSHIASAGSFANTNGVSIEFVPAFDPILVTQSDAETGTATANKIWTAQRVKQAIDKLATIGQHTIEWPAGAMTPGVTNGPSWGKVELSTNKFPIVTLDFHKDNIEYAYWSVLFPKSWDGGTLLMQPVWSHTGASVYVARWGFSAYALGNNEDLDTAFGTEATVDDTGGTNDRQYIGDEVAMTVGNSPAGEKRVYFRLSRVASHGNDTLNVDGRFHEVRIHYTTNAATDS